jgi:hypothetical protein
MVLCVFLSSSALAQQLTGSLRGIISDPDGNPLPGVTVTVTSEAIMGAQTYVSTETGAFRFPALPPGTYKLTAELTGFKTLNRENIVVRVGAVVTIDFPMEVSAVQEEVTVIAASPTVDVESTKIAVIMDRELLKNIPMARDLYDIMTTAPGAVSEGQTYRRTYTIHGSTVRSNTTAFDGVNMNDPVVMYPLTNINFDVMDEVESITAGHPASIGSTDGAYVNIVTKSGGNRFSGGAVVYLTNESLSQHLWTDEQVTALGVAKPEVSKKWLDGSLTFGGPIAADRIWFFTNGRFISQERKTNFIGPFTDILGYTHEPYNWTHEEKMGFFKLTGQLTSAIKLMGMFNFVDIYRPMYEEPGSRTNFIATRVWDHEKGYTGNAVVNYVLNQNTYLDFRFGYVHRYFPIPLQPKARDSAWVDDGGDLYGGLTTARFNETYLRKRMQFGTYFTRFQDNFIGGNHEFKGGVEYEKTYGDWDWWRKDNMLYYLDSRYPPKNYYYNTYGRVDFYICGQEEGSTKIQDQGGRIGAYIQDSVTFAERLTLNIGIRFDRSWGWKPAVNKEQGSPLSFWVGENVVKPYVAAAYPSSFPDGINPWAAMSAPEWKDIIAWNEFSPRLGITYDPFGDGKTAFKFSFNRYTEYLMLQYFSTLHPFYPRSFAFNWTDTDNSNWPSIGDTFTVRPTDYRGMDPEFAKKRLDPNSRSPIADELTLGVWRELFRDFSLGLNFIYKEKRNIAESVYYAPDTGEYWYHPDQDAAKKYWVPFTTTIPGTDKYPAQTVTFYVRRNDSPEPFTQFTNVPELKRTYWAAEIIFNKRMSNGWQFGGSIVYSKAYGNLGGWYDQSWGWSGLGATPNLYVNSYGRINTDRPLQIKLYGTVLLPYRLFLSAFYQYQDGAPWTRYVSIRPPTAWTTATNTYRDYYGVNIEQEGSRRNRAWNQLDVRLEKEFALGRFGRLGAYLDVENLLGFSGVNLGLDDVYRWEPVAEGANQAGTKTLETSYKVISSVTGTREVRASLRFSF